jgi:hypothetical protein
MGAFVDLPPTGARASVGVGGRRQGGTSEKGFQLLTTQWLTGTLIVNGRRAEWEWIR